MYHGMRYSLTVTAFLAMCGWATLSGLNSFANAQESSPLKAQPVAMTSQSPGWAQQLKGQTITENAMEGRAERSALRAEQRRCAVGVFGTIASGPSFVASVEPEL